MMKSFLRLGIFGILPRDQWGIAYVLLSLGTLGRQATPEKGCIAK
jgi:hypothetical protein